MELQMRPLDPRRQKTIAIIWLAVFGFWLGGLDEKATYDAHYWLMSAVFVMGIASAAYVVLLDDWKSKAVFVILLVSSGISIGGVDARELGQFLLADDRRTCRKHWRLRLRAPARCLERQVCLICLTSSQFQPEDNSSRAMRGRNVHCIAP
jgi:hypothetical protein